MKPRPVITRALGILVALLAGMGPLPAVARADRAEASEQAPQRSFGAEETRRSRTVAEAFDDACDLYDQGRWSAAYGRFARLADAGHARAAEVAVLMLSYGPRLYGQSWSASPSQIDRWIALSLRRTEALMASAGE